MEPSFSAAVGPAGASAAFAAAVRTYFLSYRPNALTRDTCNFLSQAGRSAVTRCLQSLNAKARRWRDHLRAVPRRGGAPPARCSADRPSENLYLLGRRDSVVVTLSPQALGAHQGKPIFGRHHRDRCRSSVRARSDKNSHVSRADPKPVASDRNRAQC